MIGRGAAAELTGVADDTSTRGSERSSARLDVPPFKSIYAQYFGFVWSSARRLGVRPAAVEDMVQEIFMVIHRRLETLEQPESLRSWIYGIVRRTVSGYHRSNRTKDASDTALALQIARQWETQLTPLELTEQNEEAKLLWQVLGEIDAPKREVLVLVEIEGMTAPEISQALDIPLNTAYSRLRTARFEFEAALARRIELAEGRGSHDGA